MFKLFGKKEAKPTPPTPVVHRRVVIEGQKPLPPPPIRETPATDPLKQKLLFQGLHVDTNPSEFVRTGQMTCPSCSTNFRHFLNSDGKKTLVTCPTCAKAFRL